MMKAVICQILATAHNADGGEKMVGMFHVLRLANA